MKDNILVLVFSTKNKETEIIMGLIKKEVGAEKRAYLIIMRNDFRFDDFLGRKKKYV